ncbi:MAG: DUF4142 domain-containing protein [Bacteroidia bacterium]
MKYFKNKLLQVTLLTTTIFSLSSCSNNQEAENTQAVADESNQAKFDTTAKAKDAEFLVQAAEINLEEIQLGQLAQQKSKLADIKELGKMMEVQHSQCFIDLTALAQKESITIPTEPNNNVENDYKMLSHKSGTDFDTTYCNMMVNGHKKAIAIFEKESIESNNTDIKQWAAETLPNLGIHLDHAIACQSKCKK